MSIKSYIWEHLENTFCKKIVYLFRIIGNVCIFVMLSEPPCRFGHNKTASLLVLIVKVLEMKTYTLTWKHLPYYGSTLSRCKFDSLNTCMWNPNLPNDKVLQFMDLLSRSVSAFRLVKNGRLIARAATYQGV